MKIQPVASPVAIQQAPSNNQAARARAEAAFMGQQNAPQVVQNQNAISAEEMGAIRAPSQVEELPENTIVEESQAVTEAPVEKDPALSRQFAQLARNEKNLRIKIQKQEQALRQREAALAEREAAAAKVSQPDLSGYISKADFKRDPLAVMAETGLSYDEITQQLINQQPRDPRVEANISRLEAKIRELEEKNEKSVQSQAEQQQAQYNAAVKQIELDARALIKSDPSYEAIRATGSVKDVVKLITETYNQDKILLTVEQAAEEVENHLVEELSKYSRINKIKQRIQQASAKPAVSPQKPQATNKQPQQMKTLTNATSSSRQLTARERALLAFKGELKS